MSTKVWVDVQWFICLLLTATIQIEFKYCKHKSFCGVLGTVIQLQSSRGKCCIAALFLFRSKSLLACNMQGRSFNTSRLFSASLCRSAISINHIIKTSLTSFGDGGERVKEEWKKKKKRSELTHWFPLVLLFQCLPKHRIFAFVDMQQNLTSTLFNFNSCSQELTVRLCGCILGESERGTSVML